MFLTSGELQSILCAVYASNDIVYTGTLSGDVYKWKGHTLQSTIKGAHQVSYLEMLIVWYFHSHIVLDQEGVLL